MHLGEHCTDNQLTHVHLQVYVHVSYYFFLTLNQRHIIRTCSNVQNTRAYNNHGAQIVSQSPMQDHGLEQPGPHPYRTEVPVEPW